MHKFLEILKLSKREIFRDSQKSSSNLVQNYQIQVESDQTKSINAFETPKNMGMGS